MTAPTSRIVVSSLTFDLAAHRRDALGDEDDRERVRDRPDEERDVPPDVALDEVDVALDDAAEPDQLVAQGERHRSHRSSLLSVLERVAARSEERLLERLRAVARLELVGRLEAEQLAVVEDPDAVGEGLGLGEVVRAEQDGRVVLGAHLADELLHLLLRARVETRGRLVQQQQDRRGQQGARERDLLLHAARQALHRVAAAVVGETDPLEDLRDLVTRVARRACRRSAPRSSGSRPRTSS